MKIHIVTTGGTIEKVYSESSGQVENVAQKIDRYLQSMKLRCVATLPPLAMHHEDLRSTIWKESDGKEVRDMIARSLSLLNEKRDEFQRRKGTNNFELIEK